MLAKCVEYCQVIILININKFAWQSFTMCMSSGVIWKVQMYKSFLATCYARNTKQVPSLQRPEQLEMKSHAIPYF